MMLPMVFSEGWMPLAPLYWVRLRVRVKAGARVHLRIAPLSLMPSLDVACPGCFGIAGSWGTWGLARSSALPSFSTFILSVSCLRISLYRPLSLFCNSLPLFFFLFWFFSFNLSIFEFLCVSSTLVREIPRTTSITVFWGGYTLVGRQIDEL